MQNGRLEQIDQHLKLMKKSLEDTNFEISRISSALVGNEYTGGVGIVHQMKIIKDDLQKNKDDVDILKENMALVKWFGSIIGGLVVAMIIYILQKAI